MVPEMWLSACVGFGSKKNVGGAKPKMFQCSLTRLRQSPGNLILRMHSSRTHAKAKLIQ